ncbi:hypothetical protein TIFTF001_047168 [Ficus carica]|uniref:Uncharacterized protein n=1 Tax=Ficus carica TaxID=3494 RepID=A0AA87YQY2_FICCA|nr:hypothetical protein TIFTF001_047168 [Ficus carica]
MKGSRAGVSGLALSDPDELRAIAYASLTRALIFKFTYGLKGLFERLILGRHTIFIASLRKGRTQRAKEVVFQVKKLVVLLIEHLARQIYELTEWCFVHTYVDLPLLSNAMIGPPSPEVFTSIAQSNYGVPDLLSGVQDSGSMADLVKARSSYGIYLCPAPAPVTAILYMAEEEIFCIRRGLAERVAVADEKRDLAGGCELVANVVEPTLAYVVAGSDSITSANLRAAFPSACNKRSQRPLFDRLRPVSAIYLMDECALLEPFPGLTS